jgi:heme/copper-type cytochrome/quinol oxidase subunit 2
MRQRIARASLVVVVALTTLWTAVPAWANAPNPEMYPEAYEQYQQNMTKMFWGILGCSALFVIVMIVLVVLLIRWIIRRRREHVALDAAAEAPLAPDSASPLETE